VVLLPVFLAHSIKAPVDPFELLLKLADLDLMFRSTIRIFGQAMPAHFLPLAKIARNLPTGRPESRDCADNRRPDVDHHGPLRSSSRTREMSRRYSKRKPSETITALAGTGVFQIISPASTKP